MVLGMGWSLAIGRLFGIPVKVHATLVILLGVLALISASNGFRGLLMVVLLFGSVLVHELGHALVARRYGVMTREIVLLPIGGAALLAEHPKEPRHEFWIALAGPLVSLGLAGLAFGMLQVLPIQFFADLMLLNLILGAFNLLPAFPLDGGRVLRAVLTRWMGKLRATRMAAKLGRFISVAFVILGLYYGEYLLPFVGVFVFVAATLEERAAIIHAIIGNRHIRDLMEPITKVFGASASLNEVRQYLDEHTCTSAVPVGFGARIIGIVRREQILAAPRTQGVLADVLDRDVARAPEGLALLELLKQMSEQKTDIALIVAADDDEDVRGIITVQHVLAEIRAAQAAEF
ncbi:MAG: Zn-dependent protease [Myxococcota bacterium]|jgi:Zn-dependent protease